MRYAVSLMGRDGRWHEVLYTDSKGRALRVLVYQVAANPDVVAGIIEDTLGVTCPVVLFTTARSKK